MKNIIDEYLIKLGVDIDDESVKELTGSVHKIDALISKSSTFGKNIVKAGGLLGGVFLSVAGSVTALTTSMAKQDQQMTTLGATMMTGKAQAMAMKQAVDALGASISDIQINPELRKQYTDLLQDGRRMMDATGEYESVMRDMRELMFEFTRLKQEAQASLRWIAYYIIRDFSGPLGDAKETLRSINEYIIQNLPNITRKIATGLGYVIQIGSSFSRLVRTVFQRLKELWDSFPSGTKKAIMALTLMGAILMSGPIGKIAAAIGGILLLIDDFYGYLDGKDAALGPVWDEVLSWEETASEYWNELLGYINQFFSSLEDSPTLERWIDLMIDLGDALFDLGKTLSELVIDGLEELFSYFRDTGTVDDATDAYSSFQHGLQDIIESIIWLIKGFTKLLKVMRGDPTAQTFWKGIKTIIDAVIDATVKAVKGIGRVASIIAKLLKGDIAGAVADIGGLAADIKGGLGIGSAGANELDAAEYLMKNGADLGIGKEEAAAIVANLIRESSLDPTSLIIDSNGLPSGGIAQWNGPRLDALKSFAAANGVDWQDKKVQLDFLLNELRSTHNSAINAMANARGVGDKAEAFTRTFEAPDLTRADIYAAVQEQRGIANDIYNGLNNRAPKPAPTMASSRDNPRYTSSQKWGGYNSFYEAFNDMVQDAKAMWNGTYYGPGNNFTGGDTTVNVNVNIGNTNASPTAIGNAVASKVSSVLPNRNIPVIFNGGSGIS